MMTHRGATMGKVHPRLLVVAAQLLTRLPIGDVAQDDRDRAAAVGWFAVVGAMVGGLSGFVWWASSLALPKMAAATLAFLTASLVTGASHERGLAATADGLFSGAGPDARLRAMTDRATSAVAVVALVMVTLLRVTLLAALSPVAGAVAMVVSGTLSRGATAVALIDAVPADLDPQHGMAMVDHVRTVPAVVAGVSAVAATVAFAGLDAIAVVVAAGAAVLAVRLMADRRLGGLTRHVFGAMVLLADVAAMAMVVGLEVGAGL